MQPRPPAEFHATETPAAIFAPNAALIAPRPSGFAARLPMAAPPAPETPPEIAPEPEAPPSPGPNVVLPPPPMYSARQLDEARAEAMAAGLEQGRAEAMALTEAERADLAQAAGALRQALALLAAPPQAQVDALAHAMSVAVLRLASERAGQVIDHEPAPFARRVAALAARLSQAAAGFELRLHPADLARLQPLVAAGLPADLAALAGARLVADETLARGDADLSAPGLRIADLLADLEPPPPPLAPVDLPGAA